MLIQRPKLATAQWTYSSSAPQLSGYIIFSTVIISVTYLFHDQFLTLGKNQSIKQGSFY